MSPVVPVEHLHERVGFLGVADLEDGHEDIQGLHLDVDVLALEEEGEGSHDLVDGENAHCGFKGESGGEGLEDGDDVHEMLLVLALRHLGELGDEDLGVGEGGGHH